MTDEAKAEEYLKDTPPCYYSMIKRGYLDGLAEGRKEKEELIGMFINVDLEKENETMKTILLDVFKKHGDLCSLCEVKGQKLPECKCMKDNECLKHIIELYGAK